MTPLESGILPFTKSACLTTDDFDSEIPCEPYRAHWNELADRSIQITKIERDGSRFGRPTLWVVDVLSRLEVDALENLIQKQLREQRVTHPWTAEDEFDSRKHEVAL